MCFKIYIKNYSAVDGYYRIALDKSSYDRNNFNLYYLIKHAYISQLLNEENDLTTKLIAFENNLQKANMKGEIISNKGQVFVFDEKGNFQTFAKTDEIKLSAAIKQVFEKIREFFSGKIKINSNA